MIYKIVLYVCVVISILGFIFCLFEFISQWIKKGKKEWGTLIIGLFFIPALVAAILFSCLIYIYDVWNAGGIKKYYSNKKKEKAEAQERAIEAEKRKREKERIAKAFRDGELKREELPRKENGINRFEFYEEMGLKVEEYGKVREIIYVENGYNECLNSFFMRHQNLRLYKMYKFVYLPCFTENLKRDSDLLHYFCPGMETGELKNLQMDSSYPLQFLCYPEDLANIEHGMFFFAGGVNRYDVNYISGHYYPLEEGDDESITQQLDSIVKMVHSDHGMGGLYSIMNRPEIKEGSSKDYADELFPWVTSDIDVAKLVDEIRERMEQLEELGLPKNLLRRLFDEKVKLSRLIVTKDMRILLPDYNDIEINMEPIVKAVYLLFLKHPEGIRFKHLPDFRKELSEIYQNMKPMGLNERAIRSIEDVTNPCQNSINEKCARIRAAFMKEFDKHYARNYFITGERGMPKKILLPRELVIWE